MAISIDRLAYLRSLGEELDAQASRVRNLIGDAHWPSDGLHKEALLRGILARHLPADATAATGFIVDPLARLAPSTQQDILILDRREPPLFQQGGLTVSSPSAALALIEVKSAFRADSLHTALSGLLTRDVLYSSATGAAPWLGIYFFDAEQSASLDSIAEATAAALARVSPTKRIPDQFELCIRATADMFGRVSLSPPTASVNVFAAHHCATGYFVARLLDHLAGILHGVASPFADMADAVHTAGDIPVRRDCSLGHSSS